MLRAHGIPPPYPAMPSFSTILLWLLATNQTQAASVISQPGTNLSLHSSTNTSSSSGLSTLSFQQTVYRTVVHTLARYPLASLYEIEAVSTTGATTDPYLLNDIRLIFAIPDHAPNTTLIVEMSDVWGIWQEPRLSILQVQSREKVMPRWVDMDIDVANDHKERAGFMGPYWSFIICWPVGLPPERDQPMYMFQMEDESRGYPETVCVGTRDGRVTATYNHSCDEGVVSEA